MWELDLLGITDKSWIAITFSPFMFSNLGGNAFSFQRRTHYDTYDELKNGKNMFLSRNSDLVTKTKHGMENKMIFCHS